MNQYTVDAFLYTPDFGEDAYLFNSSSSSSDSDEYDECTCKESKSQQKPETPAKKPRTEGFIEIEVPLLNEYDFKNSFRVSRATFDKVLEMLHGSFVTDHKGGRERITAEKATYMLLWYLGNQETFKQMSDRFKNTMSSIHGVVKSAINTLSSKLRDQIMWPSDDEYPKISEMFEEISNLKGCIGVLGVSYIKIPKPKEEGENYLCLKKYSCMALQGAVTINGKFLDIFINVGSCDAEQVLKTSTLLPEADNNLLGDYYLVGLNNYVSRSWLVQPYENADSLTPMHSFFNACHEAATNVFPESLGYLKGRFQRLQNLENRDVAIVTQCIETACMIHNLAIDCDDENGAFFYSDTGIFENAYDDVVKIEIHDDGGRRKRAFDELSEKHNRDN